MRKYIKLAFERGIEEGRIFDAYTHGFNLPGGGWCLYDLHPGGHPRAKFIRWIPKGYRRPRTYPVSYVKAGLPEDLEYPVRE